MLRCQRKKVGNRLAKRTLIEASLRLVNEVGLDGLTVRRLAMELGVQSPALYWHIHSKQELVDGMAEEIILEAGMGSPRKGESWQDWLARRARAYRGSLLAHRDGARVVTGARQLSAATIRQFEDELTAMVEHGFTPVLALRTVSNITNYVNGFVLQEQSGAQGGAQIGKEQLLLLAQLVETGPASNLVSALREGGSIASDDAFETGLQALIEGTNVNLNRHGIRKRARGHIR